MKSDVNKRKFIFREVTECTPYMCPFCYEHIVPIAHGTAGVRQCNCPVNDYPISIIGAKGTIPSDCPLLSIGEVGQITLDIMNTEEKKEGEDNDTDVSDE